MMRRTKLRPLLGLLAVASAAHGCAKVSPVPLRPEPIAYDDTLPIVRPADRDPVEVERLLEVSVGGEIGRAFSMRRWLGADHEAINITRFDDVVNSAWFENRNGRRRLPLEAVARGSTTVGPDTSRTLTVIGGKTAGISPGFTVRDANGTSFLFKFDPRGNLHLASAAGVISNRLFWAAGYHTPEDFIVVFDSARLELDPQAEIEATEGERPMTAGDIQTVLEGTDPLPDGRFLAVASKYVPGRPIGPFLFSGIRADDPNDYYFHEHRRELRGLYVVSSWLNHVDMRFANTLDVYIDPPGYVRHYLIDFAATLGSGTIRSHRPREGTEYNFDLWSSVGRMLTFGFLEAGWEGEIAEEIHPAIGWIPVETFVPAKWKPNWPNSAFNNRTPRDNYWGAKLVGSFTDEQIAAVVREGQLPQEAEEPLIRILIQRRDKVVSYYYAQVTPVENVATRLRRRGAEAMLEVSFDDLGLTAGVWEPAETRYYWAFDNPPSRRMQRGDEAARAGHRQTIRLALADLPGGGPAEDSQIAVLRLVAQRPGAQNREAVIYLHWDGAARGYSVVGLEH